MPLLNTVVSFPTVFLQVLMACVHKNFKLCDLSKLWCKSNFTQFGNEFAVKYIGVHFLCSIYIYTHTHTHTHTLSLSLSLSLSVCVCVHTIICIAPYTYVVKDNIYPVFAVKAQRGSRGIALLFL